MSAAMGKVIDLSPIRDPFDFFFFLKCISNFSQFNDTKVKEKMRKKKNLVKLMKKCKYFDHAAI